jgi:hypothetical protein
MKQGFVVLLRGRAVEFPAPLQAECAAFSNARGRGEYRHVAATPKSGNAIPINFVCPLFFPCVDLRSLVLHERSGVR